MTSCDKTIPVDLIIHNARIYTLNRTFKVQEAMAIKDGKIVEVGPENAILNRYETNHSIDAETRPIYPGFIDAHCHFIWYAKSLSQLDLRGTKSFNDVIDKVVQFFKQHKKGWIEGAGWNQTEWNDKQFPTKEVLDSLFPNRPVFLTRIDRHAALANQKALDLAGITTQTKVEGGEILSKDGKLTGMLIDHALDLVTKVIPEMDNKTLTKNIQQAQENCFAAGLTTLDDAGLSKPTIDLIEKLQKEKILKMKMYIMLLPDSTTIPYYFENGPVKTDLLHICSFKFFADGALGSRGAKMIKPYTDDKSTTGLFLKDSSYFQDMAEKVYKHGFQMNTHAIGDAANRMMLHIYGNVLKDVNDRRWRIEHCQIVAPEDFKLFKKYTIIPSIQPQFATSDMSWAGERIGKKRIKDAYAWKKLEEQNGIVALGTDFPIESIQPIRTFYAAVFRKDTSGKPAKRFQMENALSRKQALIGMTLGAAISNFEDSDKGSLEKGKAADFVILDRDIMQVDEKDVLGTNVIGTFINGEKVYWNKNFHENKR